MITIQNIEQILSKKYSKRRKALEIHSMIGDEMVGLVRKLMDLEKTQGARWTEKIKSQAQSDYLQIIDGIITPEKGGSDERQNYRKTDKAEPTKTYPSTG